MTTTTPTGTRTLNQTLGLVFGAVYVLVGVIGFALTGFGGFADTHGEHILGLFEVNPLHNIVHLAVGVTLAAAASKSLAASRGVNSLVGGVYLLVGVVGLFILDSSANILALNGLDNGLHFASAAVLLGIGLGADRRR